MLMCQRPYVSDAPSEALDGICSPVWWGVAKSRGAISVTRFERLASYPDARIILLVRRGC